LTAALSRADPELEAEVVRQPEGQKKDVTAMGGWGKMLCVETVLNNI